MDENSNLICPFLDLLQTFVSEYFKLSLDSNLGTVIGNYAMDYKVDNDYLRCIQIVLWDNEL